jgi:hypothetical protein
MNSYLKLHIGILVIWVSLALVLGLKVALLGSEEIALKKARGADLKARNDLIYQRDRAQSQLEYEASAPALDAAVRALGLPLSAPLKTAQR